MVDVVFTSSICRSVEKELNFRVLNNRILNFRDSAKITRLLCSALFVVFTFAYLYYYQADVLAVVIHVLFSGHIQYDRKIGTVFITIVLYLLHVGVVYLIKPKKGGYSLTFFPSLLMLTLITDFVVEVKHPNRICFDMSVWLFLLPIAVYGMLLWAYFRLKNLSEDRLNILFGRFVWIDFLMIFVMFLIVGVMSNHNDVFHYRAHMEKSLIDNNYEEALSTGKNTLQTDSSLTMLRIFALSKEGILGEALFEYPLIGTSKVMLPNHNVGTLMLPKAVLYENVGVVVKQQITPLEYLEYIEKHHLEKKAAADYLLCGYLLDKKLDTFVDKISKYYDIRGTLPKHYREALILYTHLRSNPKFVYCSNVMDTDFQDFQDLNRKYPRRMERMNIIRDIYGKTYWYYYLYA